MGVVVAAGAVERVGLAVGDNVAVSVGGGMVGVPVGGGDGVAVGGTGVEVGAGTVTGAVGKGVGDGIGVNVGNGTGVLVARASTMRVLVGVAVTAGVPGAHCTRSNPARHIPSSENQCCLAIAKRHTFCDLSSSFKSTARARQSPPSWPTHREPSPLAGIRAHRGP